MPRLHHLRREQRIEQYVAAYAATLERTAKRYPYQWFNFFDYWGDAAE